MAKAVSGISCLMVGLRYEGMGCWGCSGMATEALGFGWPRAVRSLITSCMSKNFSCSAAKRRCLRQWLWYSMLCFSPSRRSTSCRLRSRED